MVRSFSDQLLDLDPDRVEQLDRILDPVVFIIKNSFHVPKIDQALGALNAGEVSDKNKLFDHARSIAVDDGVLLGVQAAAIAWLVAIAAIVQARRIAIVAHGEHFSEVRAGNDRSDLKPMTGGALSQRLRQAHINRLKTWAKPIAHVDLG